MIDRVIVLVLDAVGFGALPDAAKYGDEGADTLAHVLDACDADLPALYGLGLGNIRPGVLPRAVACPVGGYGRLMARAAGKDTTSGHWEIAGCTLAEPFPTYPRGFPDDVIEAFERASGYGVIGNCAASGTEIIARLGEAHMASGKLIVYTSADSVFQIAAHERVVPPEDLWRACEAARRILTPPNMVGRVIARPFAGEAPFARTGNRRDFSVPPLTDTMLDVVKARGMDVLGVGKIEDIFAHRGLTWSEHAAGNEACLRVALHKMSDQWRGLMMVNLVDTDSLYGHRGDVSGFASELERIDAAVGRMMERMRPCDMLIITADHGCDPTTPGTDHTREHAPLLCYGPTMRQGVDLGTRATLADVSATALEALGIENTLDGQSFLELMA